jgi:sugar phosphate isomerase/epimerase
MSTTNLNRREFVTRTIIGASGVTMGMSALTWASEHPSTSSVKIATPSAEKLGWRLSCGVYTFRDRSFYETLDVIAGVGIRAVEPAFFLPLDKERPDLKTSEALSPALRREMKKRMDDRGIKMCSYYAPIEGDQTIYRPVFDFAKEMGAETLVAEPPAEALEALEVLCNEYKINLALHNHPEGSGSHYWNPDSFVKACAGRGQRIGGCPDTGHWVRTGLDTLASLKKYQSRVLTIHLKDAQESGKRDSRDVPLGTGKANYTALLNQLYEWKWRGVMTIEYEHQSPQLVQDVTQCVKFVEDFARSKLKG